MEKSVSFGHDSLEPALIIIGQMVNSTYIEIILIAGWDETGMHPIRRRDKGKVINHLCVLILFHKLLNLPLILIFHSINPTRDHGYSVVVFRLDTLS